MTTLKKLISKEEFYVLWESTSFFDIVNRVRLKNLIPAIDHSPIYKQYKFLLAYCSFSKWNHDRIEYSCVQ